MEMETNLLFMNFSKGSAKLLQPFSTKIEGGLCSIDSLFFEIMLCMEFYNLSKEFRSSGSFMLHMVRICQITVNSIYIDKHSAQSFFKANCQTSISCQSIRYCTYMQYKFTLLKTI